MSPLRSLDYANSVEKAYSFIKEGILTRRLKEKERLGTQELAERLRISRTPVREALARLEQEGLVSRDSGWGYVVKGFSAAEVLDFYRVREVLEVEAIREAIPRLDERLVDLLTSLTKKAEDYVRSGDFSEFQSVNRQFYALIAQTTGNQLLQQLLRTFSDRIRILGALVIAQYVGRANQILEENRRILNALKLRDAPAAELAVREHIHQARDHVLLYFGQQPKQKR